MDKSKEDSKRISGYYNPYEAFPAFVYPIFKDAGNKKESFLQCIGENDEIMYFEKKNLNYKEVCQDTKQYKVGDQAVYAYALNKDEIYFDNKANMVKKLKEVEKTYDFSKVKYTHIELLTFVGDYQKAIKVVKQIKKAEKNSIIDDWAEDQIKEYKEKIEKNNLPTCQFVYRINEVISQKVKNIHKDR